MSNSLEPKGIEHCAFRDQNGTLRHTLGARTFLLSRTIQWFVAESAERGMGHYAAAPPTDAFRNWNRTLPRKFVLALSFLIRTIQWFSAESGGRGMGHYAVARPAVLELQR